MRHIPLRDQEPDTAWLAKANRLLDELKAAPDLPCSRLLCPPSAHGCFVYNAVTSILGRTLRLCGALSVGRSGGTSLLPPG
jgi:hypothetical protein